VDVTSTPAGPTSPPTPGFREFARLWLYVGLVNFGGPSAQIALMHRLVVDERRWLGDARFLHALNYCMLLPGPEAQQLATYVGWLLHGVRGGLVAGALFILPGFLVILALSALYAGFSEVPLVAALFFGIKAAVLAVVVEAVLRIGRRILGSRTLVAIAVAAFVAIFFLQVPFPAIVLAAALVGLIGSRTAPEHFTLGRKGHGSGQEPPPEDVGLPNAHQASGAIRAALHCALAWFLVLALLLAALGPGHVFSEIALFFSKMAVLTFGGPTRCWPTWRRRRSRATAG
jgi:chromate transporter